MKVSGGLEGARGEREVVLLGVGTPATERGDADLSYVESVAGEISGGVDEYKVVVEKSTVPVYTSQWIRTIIIRDGADPALFDVASNPEFLREGVAGVEFFFSAPSTGGGGRGGGEGGGRDGCVGAARGVRW